MKISELIKQLTAIKDKDGDLPVVWESLSHTWPVELTVKGEQDKRVVVNA